ncbi:MAG: replication-relaxation family protein [Solirubrobacterales bacterium]|nr:replication-relaxation family protein [Solirubrobacterales bacterium]
MARRDLARLSEKGAVVRLKHRAGYRPGGCSTVYGLGGLGRRVTQAMAGHESSRQRTYREPGGPFIEHTLAVSETLVRLREAERHRFLTVKEFHGEPRCWRNYISAAGAGPV